MSKKYSLIILIFVTVAWAQPKVEVRSHTVIGQKTDLTVGDVAEFSDVEEDLQSTLSQVRLGDAPQHGERRVFTNSVLSSLLRKHMSDSHQSERIQLTIPRRIVVESQGPELPEEEVRSQLLEHWQELCGLDCEVQLERLRMPRISQAAQLTQWKLGLKRELPRGPFSIPVELKFANGHHAAVWVQGQVEFLRPVPVASRALMVGERVQPNDFIYELRPVTQALDGVPQQDDLIGKRIRQAIRAQGVIWTNSLERERALRRGDLVRVHVRTDLWQVTTHGVAEQDAFIGDVVNVRNPKSNQLISGQVVDSGEVIAR